MMPGMATTRVNVTVSGLVQGVFFRASTQEEARRRGLTGWVRNLPDGRVEVEAQGPEDRIAGLVAWLGAGPPDAEVREVASRPVDVVPGEHTFTQR